MKKVDEREAISIDILKVKLLKDARQGARLSLVLLLFMLPLNILVTVILRFALKESPGFLSFLFCAVICVTSWGLLLVFLCNTTLNPLFLRRDFERGLLQLDEDEILYTDVEIRRGSRTRNHRQVFVIFLQKYGRYEIQQSLWDRLAEGDLLYVAYLQKKKKRILGVYSVLTHKRIDS